MKVHKARKNQNRHQDKFTESYNILCGFFYTGYLLDVLNTNFPTNLTRIIEFLEIKIYNIK